jgi:hypothetical protein
MSYCIALEVWKKKRSEAKRLTEEGWERHQNFMGQWTQSRGCGEVVVSAQNALRAWENAACKNPDDVVTSREVLRREVS